MIFKVENGRLHVGSAYWNELMGVGTDENGTEYEFICNSNNSTMVFQFNGVHLENDIVPVKEFENGTIKVERLHKAIREKEYAIDKILTTSDKRDVLKEFEKDLEKIEKRKVRRLFNGLSEFKEIFENYANAQYKYVPEGVCNSYLKYGTPFGTYVTCTWITLNDKIKVRYKIVRGSCTTQDEKEVVNIIETESNLNNPKKIMTLLEVLNELGEYKKAKELIISFLKSFNIELPEEILEEPYLLEINEKARVALIKDVREKFLVGQFIIKFNSYDKKIREVVKNILRVELKLTKKFQEKLRYELTFNALKERSRLFEVIKMW